MIQSSLFAEPGRPGRGSAGGAVVRICREERLVSLILLRPYEVFGCHGDTVRGQVPRGLPQPPPQLVFALLRLTGFGEALKGQFAFSSHRLPRPWPSDEPLPW